MHILFADILKSPTGIDEITNQYWPNHQLVLTNLTIHTYKLCISFLPTFWNRQLVLPKSPTGIGQIANRYWPNRQPVLMKLYTKETSWRFSQYRFAILPIRFLWLNITRLIRILIIYNLNHKTSMFTFVNVYVHWVIVIYVYCITGFIWVFFRRQEYDFSS